jgi:group I intron endonuclease
MRVMIIYLVINKVNGKMYVGQTRKKLIRRKDHHIWKSVYDRKVPFHCAIRKYGKENFEWLVLEECGDLETLNFREQCYIAELGTLAPYGYNLASGGYGHIPKHSDVTKQKIRVKRLGIKLSDSTRKKLSLLRSGEGGSNTKLTWKIVNEIRSKYSGKRGEQTSLAKEYGISSCHVYDIVNYNKWKLNLEGK